MILVIKEKHGPEYRLQSYEDFYRLLPNYRDCHIYGKDSPNYDPNKTIYDIIKECPKDPTAILVMAPLFKFSSWSEVKAKKYLLVTDSFDSYKKMQKDKHYPRMDEIELSGIFHHYLYALKYMKSVIPCKWHYFPNWAASCYDWKKYGDKKNVDFFLSGKYSYEYAMRKTFHKAFHKSGLNFMDYFNEKRISTDDDNLLFFYRLMDSRYSPHDGVVNGRMVPRYVESCYAKSVIISPYLGGEMDLMGFVEGENYLRVDRKDSKKDIRKHMKNVANFADWKKLSTNAYDLVKKNHTTHERIVQFLEVVNEN